MLAGIWVAATVAALAIARWTKVGPILFKVSARHGIHAGDAAAFGVAFLVAAVTTIALLHRWARPDRP